MTETRTIHYDDGRRCEQQYEDGELHGLWTVFYPTGQKEWERQHSRGRKEGYYRKWDPSGCLVEEQWYHLDELHGIWREWNESNDEEIVGDFYLGCPRQAFAETINPDFNTLIKPIYGLEPEEFASRINALVPRMRRESRRLKKLASGPLDLAQRSSFWNHVNLIGAGETWPHFNGVPLFPILQINCAEIELAENPLAGYSFVTLFANSNGSIADFGEDIVIRAYRPQDKIVSVEPPCDPLDAPCKLLAADAVDSFPDENDLPPGLKVFLRESNEKHAILHQDEKLSSRLGGWPGWLQSGRISSFGKFAFQVDSLDVENWDCGDSTIHYFFLDDDASGFSWEQEMC
ncbi:MAG TPA: hypothetical protein VFW23_15955 [Tepidisphaeraceae bacterium]|nr:hypothetical protein [Tepidisphaeraceae bacterium]